MTEQEARILHQAYDRVFEDRRVGKETTTITLGQKITVREFLKGAIFFQNLEVLKTLGKPEDVRVVFHFDK